MVNDDVFVVSNFSDPFNSARRAITNESAAGFSKYFPLAPALIKASKKSNIVPLDMLIWLLIPNFFVF